MNGSGVEAPEDEDMPTTSGQQQDGVVFVLENVSLETAHVGKVLSIRSYVIAGNKLHTPE